MNEKYLRLTTLEGLPCAIAKDAIVAMIQCKASDSIPDRTRIDYLVGKEGWVAIVEGFHYIEPAAQPLPPKVSS